MRPIFKEIQCRGRSDKITIIPIGDTHLGVKNIDIKKLKGLIEWIAKTPQVYWLGMGDYIDAINFSDKRFNLKSISQTEELTDLVNCQVRAFKELFFPIRKRCLGLLDGNHEATIVSKYHQDPVAHLCMDMGIDRLTYSTLMRIYFKRGNNLRTSKSVVIYAHHGHGGGRTVAGKLNTVLVKSKSYDADIYLLGHCHLKANIDGERINVSNNRGRGDPFIYTRKQIYATTGSFMKSLGDGFSPYSEVNGYDPVPTGFIKITIEPFHHFRYGDHKENKFREEYPHIHVSV